jgi:hypothetical protein
VQNFQPVRLWSNHHAERFGRERGAGDRAKWTNVRTGRFRRQVGAEVKLCPKKNNGEEQGHERKSRRVKGHVLGNTELRQEWLRGQALPARMFLHGLAFVLTDSREQIIVAGSDAIMRSG